MIADIDPLGRLSFHILVACNKTFTYLPVRTYVYFTRQAFFPFICVLPTAVRSQTICVIGDGNWINTEVYAKFSGAM